MAIVSAFNLETRQFNAVNAFANAVLPTPIACHCAEGYKHPGFILWVQRALYRLKTSPILWYKEFMHTLEELGLNPVSGINCMFANDWLILIFYVDDILAVYDSKHEYQMDKFKLELHKKYEL